MRLTDEQIEALAESALQAVAGRFELAARIATEHLGDPSPTNIFRIAELLEQAVAPVQRMALDSRRCIFCGPDGRRCDALDTDVDGCCRGHQHLKPKAEPESESEPPRELVRIPTQEVQQPGNAVRRGRFIERARASNPASRASQSGADNRPSTI